MLFESAGAGSGLTGDGLLTPAVNTDAWVKIADWYRDTFEKGLSPRGVTPEQTDDLFINGQLAFMIGGPWAIGRYDGNPDLHYAVAPVPYFEDGKPVTPTGSWALSINPNSEQIDAARKFAEFVSLNGEGAFLSVVGQPAAAGQRRGLQDSTPSACASMTDKIGPVIDIITYELQNTAVGRPRTVGYVAFETVMNKAFSDIRNGAEAKATLDDAQGQLSASWPASSSAAGRSARRRVPPEPRAAACHPPRASSPPSASSRRRWSPSSCCGSGRPGVAVHDSLLAPGAKGLQPRELPLHLHRSGLPGQPQGHAGLSR